MYQSFSIGPSKEYSRLIFFRIDWFDLCCSPRDSQGSSPTPQFKSTSSSELSLLYGPTLISKHDYWKKHSFDYTLGQKRQHGSQRPQVSEKNSIQDPEDHWEQFAQLALHWNYLHVLYAMLHGFISILSSVLNFLNMFYTSHWASPMAQW